jgi:hypothetical protein
LRIVYQPETNFARPSHGIQYNVEVSPIQAGE